MRDRVDGVRGDARVCGDVHVHGAVRCVGGDDVAVWKWKCVIRVDGVQRVAHDVRRVHGDGVRRRVRECDDDHG